MTDNQSDVTKSEREHVNIDYIKSNYFRSFAPNGALHTITPNGDIQLAFYSEHQAIPQRVVHEYLPDGRLGPVTETVGRDAVVREARLRLNARLPNGWAGSSRDR